MFIINKLIDNFPDICTQQKPLILKEILHKMIFSLIKWKVIPIVYVKTPRSFGNDSERGVQGHHVRRENGLRGVGSYTRGQEWST